MKIRVFLFALVTTVLLYASMAHAHHGAHAARKAHKLELGMPEKEAVNVLRPSPDKISISTCGVNTGAPWSCKIHTYTIIIDYGFDDKPYERSKLTVFYYQNNGGWYLNSFVTH